MASSDATVTATYSRRLTLRLPDGSEADARIRGRKLKPVCGDIVTAEPIDNEPDWLVSAIHERRNALTRPNARGESEVLAANIDVIIVVAAPRPTPDWYIVDRYLCAGELMRCDVAIAWNKSDIAGGNEPEPLPEYRDIGYPVVTTSAESGTGVDLLASVIDNRIGILVGQSGVGKSSLINRLSPGMVQRTADISRKRDGGRHTTVASIMLRLPGGGSVIDSPGVRDYAPAIGDLGDAATGFREIRETAPKCRFADCRHLREPDCAVRAAVDAGDISPRRYESYRRMTHLVRSFDTRNPRRR